MTYTLTGFSAAQNSKVQNAIALACEATDIAYKAMTNIRKSQTPDKTYKNFFGPADAQRIDQVWQRMNMIQYAMNSSSVNYVRNQGRPTVYAAAQRPQSGWSEKTVRQILDKNEFSVKIDDLFYGPNVDSQLAALTIVHEMSHLVANTDDVPCPWDTYDCYGLERCRRLSDRYPNAAINNADSYGFYVIGAYVSKKTPGMAPEFDPDLSTFFSHWHPYTPGTTP